MSDRLRDPHSGALLFVPTNGEKEIAELKSRVARLENVLNYGEFTDEVKVKSNTESAKETE